MVYLILCYVILCHVVASRAVHEYVYIIKT